MYDDDNDGGVRHWQEYQQWEQDEQAQQEYQTWLDSLNGYSRTNEKNSEHQLQRRR